MRSPDNGDEREPERRTANRRPGRHRGDPRRPRRLSARHRTVARRRAIDYRGCDRRRAHSGSRRRNWMGRHSSMAAHRTRIANTERAALVGLITGKARRLDAERSLDELAGLADAAGADVVLRVLQERPRPDSSTFLGSGKIKTLAVSASETGVDVVIFDHELTPAQLRQIEEAVGRKIVDRTQLILDIFARRARTREGKLQVELAQLK